MSLTFGWYKLGRWWGSHANWWCSRYIFDSELQKATPHWQDIAAVAAVILTVVTVLIAVVNGSFMSLGWWFGVVIASLILLDMVIYYGNVLWFDDLRPGRDRRVWSFRRITIQALLSFIQSILLFGVLYDLLADVPGSFPRVLFYSFVTATTLNLPNGFPELTKSSILAYTLWSLQVLLSLLFLVVVIAILAELGLTRGEIVGSTEKEKKAGTCHGE